ncbi:Calpain-7 [Stylophora pistillata]|uniref:Calpain-7 n=1 Tax=Stylophora pistillata TaxID=50429 RepID=A0A2B4SBM3_STYPI|nr:Calpain-7 [Stylophora pistillata]
MENFLFKWRTSYINGKLFPPWLDIDLKERLAYPDCYSDKDGQLALSQKQKARFAKWLRPTELCENPEMIYAISSFSIKQVYLTIIPRARVGYEMIDSQRGELKPKIGVFWISWECVLQFFDVIYMNWNPKLFKYRFSLHSTWTAAEGPKRDAYNIGDNPQYKLELLSSDSDAVVWILLTRHITQKDDFAENKEFITVHVYKSDGRRVFYPDNPLLEGTKINSPFYLAKLNAPKGTNRFTLVVSQYEKTNTIHYTLKVFSSTEFRLSPVPVPYTVEKQVTGEWSGKFAGGCPNFSSHCNNPVYRLQIKMTSPSETAEVLLKLRGPKQFSVGAIFRSVERTSDGRPIYEAYSETYRPGFYVQQLTRVPTGTYDVIPSTFQPGQEGPFILTISASCKIALGKK